MTPCTPPCSPSRMNNSMHCLSYGRACGAVKALFIKVRLVLVGQLVPHLHLVVGHARCISTNVHITYHFPALNGENGGDLIQTYTRFWCYSTRPIYTSTDISDVATSCFPCCSYFLFEPMYIHPVWSVSALSCLRQCSSVLFLSVVANSCTSSWAVFLKLSNFCCRQVLFAMM